jgi:hypothetical protein
MGRHAEAAVCGCRPPGSGLTGLPRVRGTRRPAPGGKRDCNGIDRRSSLSRPAGDDDPAQGSGDPPPDGEAHRAAGPSVDAEPNPEGRAGVPREGSKGRNNHGSYPILKSSPAGISSIAAGASRVFGDREPPQESEAYPARAPFPGRGWGQSLDSLPTIFSFFSPKISLTYFCGGV